jgi:hypothetical protein
MLAIMRTMTETTMTPDGWSRVGDGTEPLAQTIASRQNNKGRLDYLLFSGITYYF